MEERRISLKAVVYKNNVPDMSASPQLKQRMRTKPSKGKVNIIAKKFETEQAAPKKKEGSHKPGIQHNNSTLFRQISGQTEVFNKHTGPEMAL